MLLTDLFFALMHLFLQLYGPIICFYSTCSSLACSFVHRWIYCCHSCFSLCTLHTLKKRVTGYFQDKHSAPSVVFSCCFFYQPACTCTVYVIHWLTDNYFCTLFTVVLVHINCMSYITQMISPVVFVLFNMIH